MKYVLMIYQGSTPGPGTDAWDQLSTEEQQQVYADYGAVNGMERVEPGPPLGLPSDATTVRVENGKLVKHDGPYLDPIHAVAGFLVVEADSNDAAATVAAKLPPARLGGAIEIRPVATYW